MYRLYSRLSDRETVLECWGASTKHPDSTFKFSNFELSEIYEPEDQIYPWLLECASKMNFTINSWKLAEWAHKLFVFTYGKKRRRGE